MGVNKVSKGQYQISQGVSKDELEELSNDLQVESIQFSNPLSSNEIDSLETIIFSKRPDILLRVYGHYGKVCDLTFVERLPSLRKFSADCLINTKGIESVTSLRNLEVIGVGIFDLENFNFLENVPIGIKELYLHQTKSGKPNISIIGRFSNLEILYLEKQQKGIDAIQNLHKLKEITLRSMSTDSMDYLAGLEDLWSVDIKLGGIKKFDGLATLPKLKYLELWQIRDLKDLSFISVLTALQNLFVQSLKQVNKLPNLEKLTSLRRIYLENLKSLNDLSSLNNAPALEEFIYVMAQNQEPECLIPVLENRSVKRVFGRFGSHIKNDRFDTLTELYKKDQYSHSKFEYF